MGILHRYNPYEISLHKDNAFQSKQQAKQAASLSQGRTMVAYRDGKLYVDTKRKMAHFLDRGKL